MYFCDKFILSACNFCRSARNIHIHTRVPNHKDTNCLWNNNTFYRFFDSKNVVFMTLTEKRTIRKEVRAKIAKLSFEDKQRLSSQIFSKIEHLSIIEKASVIALFISLADEPITTEIIEHLSQKKRIVVPRIEGDEMNFYDIAEGLQSGAFGIMEPIATTPIEPSEIDVMIVPGVAFTRSGARCGRGKGFYDKYLSRNGFRAYTIGVCYPCQIVDNLPTEEHDKPIHLIVED